jgi:prenyltransferase beta subunit
MVVCISISHHFRPPIIAYPDRRDPFTPPTHETHWAEYTYIPFRPNSFNLVGLAGCRIDWNESAGCCVLKAKPKQTREEKNKCPFITHRNRAMFSTDAKDSIAAAAVVAVVVAATAPTYSLKKIRKHLIRNQLNRFLDFGDIL